MCTEAQWVEAACQWILLHAGGHADTVFDVANQNLGIFCYEHVVKAFSSGGGVVVKQAGDHAIALDTEASSVVISFASSFLLLDAGASAHCCRRITNYYCLLLFITIVYCEPMHVLILFCHTTLRCRACGGPAAQGLTAAAAATPCFHHHCARPRCSHCCNNCSCA